MQRRTKRGGAALSAAAENCKWEEIKRGLVMSEYHDLQTLVQQRRVSTGNRWSMLIRISSCK